MNISEFFQYRLKSLFVVVVVTAIVMAYGTRIFQKQREVRLQRDSFAVLSHKAALWSSKMQAEIGASKGLDFNTASDGNYLGFPLSNPHFSYASRCSSYDGVVPEWKVEISIRSEMSGYPDNHLLLIEYPPSDENQKFAEMTEVYFADDKVTTRLIETPATTD